MRVRVGVFSCALAALAFDSCGGGGSSASSGGNGSGGSPAAHNVATSYFGGKVGSVANDRAQGMTLIPLTEQVVICGNTTSTDYASLYPGVPGWRKTFAGGSDAYIAILSKDLKSIVAWTYFGGDDEDRAYGVRVDANGDIWACGFTSSANFPHVGGTAHNGPSGTHDAFVVRFSPNLGSLQFATCIGGSADDSPRGSMELDGSGNVYLSGMTQSTDFPVQATAGNTLLQASAAGGDEGWVAKLDPSGSILWCTYFGGSDNDACWSGMRVNSDQQSIYFAGYTRSDTAHGFPAQNAFDTTYNGDEGPSQPSIGDAFVARMSSHGQLLACTYLGGTQGDAVSPNECVWLTSSNQVAVIGQTRSPSTGPNAFPITANAYQSVHNGPTTDVAGNDVFVAVFDESLSTLDYCSYFGGLDSDDGCGIQTDSLGRFYFTGNTQSTDFPTTNGAFQTTFKGVMDAYVACFSYDSTHTTLHYASLLGGNALVGSGFEGVRGRSLAVRPSDDFAVFSGDSDVSDFPTTTTALDPHYIGGVSDAFVAVHDVH